MMKKISLTSKFDVLANWQGNIRFAFREPQVEARGDSDILMYQRTSPLRLI
ncbi:hypothetical protein LCL85_07050 [Vibrio alginolyticus]|nr:hypothetical protein [Vibrio alginolyticus]